MSSQQMVQLIYKLKTIPKIITDMYLSRFNKISTKIKNYKMPEKLKGTFLERWGKLK